MLLLEMKSHASTTPPSLKPALIATAFRFLPATPYSTPAPPLRRILLALLPLVLFPGAVAQAQITGSAAADAITRLNKVRDASIVANSVDTGTGAFSMQATVLSVNGARPLSFPLLFDSIEIPAFIVGRPRDLGAGWTHPYAAQIQGNPNSVITVYWDDNRRNTFDFDGSSYVPREEAVRHDRLTHQSDDTWRLVRPDGTEYRFDANGRLTSLANKIGQKVQVDHDGTGRISRILEPASNKQITFQYATPTATRISYLVDPAGRETHFVYDGTGRLTALHNPTTFDAEIGDAFVPMPIPDNDPGGLVYTLSVNRTKPIGLVKFPVINIEHENVDELSISLVSPQGTSVDIKDLLDRPSVNDLNGTELVVQGFEGENPQGTWRLVVVDTQPGNTGRLNGVQIAMSDRTFPTYLTYENSRLVEAVDAAGDRLFANTYDELGRVVAQDDGRDDTPPSTFAYASSPSGGVITTYTDRAGAEQIFEHDAGYHLLRYVNPLGATTLYTYNGAGERTSIKDPLGRTTTFAYDDDGNLTRVTDPALNVSQMEYDSQHDMTRFVDAAGAETRFTYNNGNVTQVADALDQRTRKTYGANGQLVQNMMDDGAGVQYTYANGMVVGARRMDAGGDKIERTDYDALGFPTSLTDAEGRETKLEYDERLNVVAHTDPLGNRETKEYDVRNRLIRSVDAKGNVTLFRYDGNNNMVARTDALAETATYVYDAEDRRIESIDALGHSTRTAYDAAGRVVRTTNAVGDSSRQEYDAVGNLIAVYDGEDTLVRSVVYDNRDLPIMVTDAVGGMVRSAYDEVGNLIRITDSSGKVTQLRYDVLGRLIEVEDPLGRVFKKEYFSDDVVKAIEDAGGARTSFSYDSANRVTGIEPYTGSVAAVKFRYDEAYQLLRDSLPGGDQRNYEYDAGGRLTAVRYSGTNKPGDRNMTYDANGNLLRIRVDSGGNDSSGEQYQRSYDALDRVVEFTDAFGSTLRYGYDAAGNLQSVTYPDGGVVRYVYNEAKQLVEVVDWADRSTKFTYDANSHITSITFPNGIVRSMTYDKAGRLTRRFDVRMPGTMIVDYHYEYDKLGRVSVESGGQGGVASQPYMPSPLSMTYLNDGRLNMVNGTEVSYDPHQNITSAPLGNQTYQFEYNLNDRLTKVNGFTREYDAADNLIAWSGPEGRTRLTVNPQAALPQVLMKRDSDGTTHRYVYAGGLLYDEVNSKIRVYHYDYRGNTVAFSDDSGTVTGRVSYGPYGEIADHSGDSDSIFLHGGLWGVITEPDSGLQYMRYRWYAPQIKRFLSKDAHVGDIGDPSSLNHYAYGGGNPVSYNDPSGEFLNFIAAAIGAAVGAVVGVAVTVVSKAIKGETITAGDIIGSAVGGAVTGGLVGLCAGVCGPAAFLAGNIVGGAIGAAAGNLATQGINLARGEDEDGKFSLQELGVETAAGAIFGAVPFAGKGGKAVAGLGRGAAAGATRTAAKGSVSKAVRKALTPAGEIPLLIPKQGLGGRIVFPAIVTHSAVQDAARAAAKSAARKAAFGANAGAFLLDVGVGLAQEAFVDLVTGGNYSAPYEPHGAAAVQSAARQEINAGTRGVYGEFAHWGLYQSFYALAGLPLPNNPNSPLAEF
jgi:RHS repeat-associated protein